MQLNLRQYWYCVSEHECVINSLLSLNVRVFCVWVPVRDYIGEEVADERRACLSLTHTLLSVVSKSGFRFTSGCISCNVFPSDNLFKWVLQVFRSIYMNEISASLHFPAAFSPSMCSCFSDMQMSPSGSCLQGALANAPSGAGSVCVCVLGQRRSTEIHRRISEKTVM